MKSKKKKVAFPRRTWQINRVTRAKQNLQKHKMLNAKTQRNEGARLNYFSLRLCIFAPLR
jgi:hypothetical protein